MPRLIQESGLLFDPRENEFFRFEEAAYFRKVFKGRGLCEMDFGWWDAKDQVLHLLELKDYSVKPLPPNFVDELVQKATDCLLLLGSIYYGLPHAEGIKGDVPSACHAKPQRPASLQMTFVLKTSAKDHALALQPMRDAVTNRLAGRLELLDLRQAAKVVIVDHWLAQAMKIPISPAEDEPDDSRSRPRRVKR